MTAQVIHHYRTRHEIGAAADGSIGETLDGERYQIREVMEGQRVVARSVRIRRPDRRYAEVLKA